MPQYRRRAHLSAPRPGHPAGCNPSGCCYQRRTAVPANPAAPPAAARAPELPAGARGSGETRGGGTALLAAPGGPQPPWAAGRAVHPAETSASNVPVSSDGWVERRWVGCRHTPMPALALRESAHREHQDVMLQVCRQLRQEPPGLRVRLALLPPQRRQPSCWWCHLHRRLGLHPALLLVGWACHARANHVGGAERVGLLQN